MDPLLISGGLSLLGGLFGGSAQKSAADAQARADAARLEEEKRVREQLRADTEAQRAIADQAFADYQSGLISYAEAQQRAGQALQQVQQQIGTSQLSDVAKMQEMAQFKPYAIRTGVGNTFFDQATGQAGVNLSPQMQQYQQGLLGLAGQQAGAINLQATPEQQAFQQSMFGGAAQLAGNLPFQGTPEQQQFQQAMYSKAAQQAADLNLDPAAQAQKYYQQQQDILAGSRGAEDIAARQSALQRGRIGLGISTEAVGAGPGGMVNPEEYTRQLAREQVNRQIAADASQRATADIAQQLQTTQGLFGAGSGAQNQIQQALANQLAASQSMAGAGSQSQQAQQALIQSQLANAGGMFGAGMAPETYGLDVLKTGVGLGQTAAAAGMNQAQLYGSGMGDYYRSLLGAAQTGQESALAIPGAQRAGQQEAYQRQQTYLGQLQGSSLPYQAMTTPQATVPGSAYALAGLGSGMMNIGMQGLKNYFTPNAATGMTPYQLNALNQQAFGNAQYGGYPV